MDIPGRKSSVVKLESLEVRRDLSGGVRIKVGPGEFVLPPDQAIKFAEAVLKAAGYGVTLQFQDAHLVIPS